MSGYGPSARELATGKWEGILIYYDIDQRFLVNKHGPCPLCGGNDRYRYDDKNSQGDYYCSQCGPGDGFKLLMETKGWDFKQAAQAVEKIVGTVKQNTTRRAPVQDEAKRKSRLQRVSKDLQPIENTIASMYLESRGLIPTGKSLFFHPGIEYWDKNDQGQPESLGKFPALVAKVVDHEFKPVTFHITHLDKDGNKANVPSVKKILPPIGTITGAGVWLSTPDEKVGVCEGIETGLACQEMFEVPVFCALNANNLQEAIFPGAVKSVHIYGDLDQSYTGQMAAFTLANRLAVKEGRSVDVHFPDQIGQDFLDFYLAQGKQ